MSTHDISRLATWDRNRVARLAPESVLVVPIGAVEQHGPALPLGTDFALAETLAAQGIASTETDRPIVLAPTLPYGNSAHHLFACAGSLSSRTLLAVLGDLIDSFVRSGFRRLFLVNGHGGNDECVRLAVKDAVHRHPQLLAAAVSYWTLVPDGPIPPGDVPGHAGRFEASLLLAARPDLLGTDSVPAARPGPAAVHTRDFGPGVTVVRSGDWPASDGFTDDPGAADPDTGRHYRDGIVRRLAAALDSFAGLDLPEQTP